MATNQACGNDTVIHGYGGEAGFLTILNCNQNPVAGVAGVQVSSGIGQPSAAGPAAVQSDGALPFTGYDAGLTAVLATVLLVTGFVLRRISA